MGFFAMIILWGSTSVMRESDQASVIDGSLKLAVDGKYSDRNFYNYDRTYGTYWILSTAYALKGVETPVSRSEDMIGLGNNLAAVIFLLGLFPVFILYGPSKWSEWIVAVCCLFSPVLLFSAPLLSSNIISAGFLFGLVIILRGRDCMLNKVAAAIMAFCAVACRADAILVMPLLALLSTKEETFMSMAKDVRLWIVAIACVAALLLGGWIYPSEMYKPGTFFNPKLFLSYIVFSMNGSLVLLIGLCLCLCKLGWIRRSYFPLLVVASLLLPLLFYGRVLYTPRHLVTTVIVILVTIMFSRGREYWSILGSMRWVKLSLLGAGMVTILSSFVGLNMTSSRSGKPVLTQSTLYPTADGFWPMGANLWFFTRLQNANEIPIDHNQRVWQAWASIDEVDLPKGEVSVYSTGLTSYGDLRLTMLGRKSYSEVSKNSMVLIDGRSVLKSESWKSGAKEKAGKDTLFKRTNIEEVSQLDEAAIFSIKAGSSVTNERWAVLNQIKEIAAGDDFIVMRSGANWEKYMGFSAYRWFIICNRQDEKELALLMMSYPDIKLKKVRSTEASSVYSFVSFQGEKTPDFSAFPENIWIARSALVYFMQRKSF